MRKTTRFLSLALVLVLMMSIVGISGAQDDMKVIVRSTGSTSDVPSLDASLATDTSSIDILLHTTPGLTGANELTLETEPGMATWEVSEDGLTYTFNILPEIPWVHYNAESGEVEMVMIDGAPRYVTAADFAYGIGRSLSNPESYYGGIMAAWVVNGSAVYAGEADVADLGVTVIDEYTLEIHASQPATFLKAIFGMWQAYAQPQWVIDEYGEFWFEPETFVSYGPFALKEWLHGESVTLITNPFWEGTEFIPVPAIDEIKLVMLDDSASMAAYEAGDVDVIAPPLPELDRIRADEVLSAELYIGPSSCTYIYGFNTAKPPVDDARIRRALSMTIDRQSLIDNVLKGGQTPAYFFSRENMLAAAPNASDYPDLALSEDLEAAKALVQEYMDELGYADVSEIPPVTLMHNESEGHARIAQAIQQMWTDALGITIEIQTQEWGTYLETIKSDDAAPQVYRYGWCQDYSDTHNFLFDVFHTSVRDLGMSWDNPDFDALVEQAMVAPDEERTDLYAQAEYILTNEDAVMIPIYFYTTVSLTKPYIERTYSQDGHQRYYKWDISQ